METLFFSRLLPELPVYRRTSSFALTSRLRAYYRLTDLSMLSVILRCQSKINIKIIVLFLCIIKATSELCLGTVYRRLLPLNRLVLVKPKHNLLSAGADHVSTIIIVYQPVIWLFSCDLRGISIGDLPASLPIKGWISLPNHVTYAHNWGNKEAHIREISPFHTQFSINGLLLLHFYKWRNGHVAVYALLFFLHYLH